MPQKTDITEHADGELSLIFMNDEGLYLSLGFSTWDQIKEFANDYFIFTDDQLTDLNETYEEENENGDA